MQRRSIEPRFDWQKRVEAQGLHYHSLANFQPTGDPVAEPVSEGARPYWDESAYYQFEAREIDEIEKCTYALNDCCLKVVEYIIRDNLFEEVGVPASHVDWVKRSWDRDEHTILGRFDLAYDGVSPPKLLEYNADTPTGLLEAAVVQWYWLQDCRASSYQFNSIHERLLEIFAVLARVRKDRFYFTAQAGYLEDFMTVNYLRDCAIQAGCDTAYIHLHDLGWNAGRKQFTDLKEQPVRNCVKLYPWEWMTRERFAPQLLLDTCNWYEPPWKMLLSNKAMLALLYELFPDNPYILRASYDPLDGPSYVVKPVHGREGSNVRIITEGQVAFATPGPYDGPVMYQELNWLPNHQGNFPVIGSWLVNGYACGIGIREDESPITQNTSRFVPHLFTR